MPGEDGFDADKYLEECVHIDDLCLDEEFIRVPADLAYWSGRYAGAVRAHLFAKHELDVVTAKAHLSIKAGAELHGKKMTVSDLDASVKTTQEFLDATVALIEAEAAKVRLRGCLDAVSSKKDMVQSLGAKLRAEMGADPMVRVEQSKR